MDVSLETVQKSVSKILNDEQKEFMYKCANEDEYKEIVSENKNVIIYHDILNSIYITTEKNAEYYGWCNVCKKEVAFNINYLWTDGSVPAWTETAMCPSCGCNSRMRFLMDYATCCFPGGANVFISTKG